MSRRARSRMDKRAMYHSGDAPDIDAAFAKLTAERRTKEADEPEHRLLTLKDGRAIDKREPWHLPRRTT